MQLEQVEEQCHGMPEDSETQSPVDKIMNIISEKGAGLMESDMREIERLIAQLPPNDAFEQTGWIYEGLSLILNDPLYEGDIPPID